MALLELINEKTIKIPLKSKNKEDVLSELIEILDKAGMLNDKKAALEAIREREKLSSTGLGGGIAVPHAKLPEVDKMTVALGLAPKGIDFEALDGQDSTIFFLILASPDEAGAHLQALGEIANISRDAEFCEKILSAKSAAQVAELFSKLS